MAVFRVEKTRNYTVMSNQHLRDKRLSLKAKGLLSLMLSLPEDWDYTTKGLARICKDGVDSICATVRELEGAGYIVRERERRADGTLGSIEYTILEQSRQADAPKRENPVQAEKSADAPKRAFPEQVKPEQEKPAQFNIQEQSKEKQNTDLILSESETVRTKVRDNIELDLLCRNQPESAPVMQEIYELVVETIQLRSPVLRLGNNLFPMALVRERLLQLTSEHIRFVLDGLRNLHTDVKNLKKYLLTMLFNAPVTLNGRTMLDVRKSVGGGSRPMLA